MSPLRNIENKPSHWEQLHRLHHTAKRSIRVHPPSPCFLSTSVDAACFVVSGELKSMRRSFHEKPWNREAENTRYSVALDAQAARSRWRDLLHQLFLQLETWWNHTHTTQTQWVNEGRISRGQTHCVMRTIEKRSTQSVEQSLGVVWVSNALVNVSLFQGCNWLLTLVILRATIDYIFIFKASSFLNRLLSVFFKQFISRIVGTSVACV